MSWSLTCELFKSMTKEIIGEKARWVADSNTGRQDLTVAFATTARIVI